MFIKFLLTWSVISQAMEVPPIDNSCLFALVQGSDKITDDQKLGLRSMARTYREIFSMINPAQSSSVLDYRFQVWKNYRTIFIPKLNDYIKRDIAVFRCAAKEFYADNINVRELISSRLDELEGKWNRPMTCLDYLRVAICLSCLTEPQIPSYIIETMEMVLSPDLNVALVPIPLHTRVPTFNGLFGEAAILCAMLNGFMPIMFTLDPAVTAHEGLVKGPAYGIDHDLFHFTQLSRISLSVQGMLLSSCWKSVFYLMDGHEEIRKFYQFYHEDVMQRIMPESSSDLVCNLFPHVLADYINLSEDNLQTRIPSLLKLLNSKSQVFDVDFIVRMLKFRIDQSLFLRFALKHNCFIDLVRVYYKICRKMPFNELRALVLVHISKQEKHGYSDDLFVFAYLSDEPELFRETLVLMRESFGLDPQKYNHGLKYFQQKMQALGVNTAFDYQTNPDSDID